MLVFAYFGVVLIWATTPLAIQWSSHGVSFSAAVAFRMTIAATIAVLLDLLFRRQLITNFKHWKILLAASIGIFPNMPLVYWSAQYIPSGIIAVIFALSPLATGLISWWLLKNNPFTLRRVLSLSIAVFGLGLIFYQQWQLDLKAMMGVLGISTSCFLFCFSSVLVKKLTGETKSLDAFSQAVGALVFSLPGLWLVWWIQDGELPSQIPPTEAWGSILYLALIGSLIGAVLFFHVLLHLAPSTVALVTLMTPVLALWLGNLLAKEQLNFQEKTGVVLVLLGLIFYTNWNFKSRGQIIQQWLIGCFQRGGRDNGFRNHKEMLDKTIRKYK